MAVNTLVSSEQWKLARLELLAEEKAMTSALDALAHKRRSLPWVAVENDYEFRGPGGLETPAKETVRVESGSSFGGQGNRRRLK